MKNLLTSREWMAQLLAADPPRSKSLVMTILGDSIAVHGGVAWLGSLIELLAPFGVNDRLLRTSVFRLAQDGWLGASRDGRRSSYSIMPEALARFERANARIYAPLMTHWDGSWTIVMGPAGSIDAVGRGLLRKEMLWEGYSMTAPGVFIHPAADPKALDEILSRTKLRGKLYVCRASEAQGVSKRPLRDLVDEGWDLSGVVGGYELFIARFEPLLGLLDDLPAVPPEQAFAMRTLLIHAYRRVQLHDPHLPVELLPAPWPGAQAYELTRQLYRRLYAGAEEYIMAALRREDEQAGPVDEAFYQRFGGLR
ncbi:MAG: phenylacetic acid degradation operon negative regulatory protein PaaX [Burkholderiaceae bacterium]|nr:phenylacetic acid degradation operon negative regulatory protein PaaX [Burkholderiaceae bacterium]